MIFLQIIFVIKQFVLHMAGKPTPIIAYPVQRDSVTDEGRVSVQKIANVIELFLENTALGIPGRTHEEQINI